MLVVWVVVVLWLLSAALFGAVAGWLDGLLLVVVLLSLVWLLLGV